MSTNKGGFTEQHMKVKEEKAKSSEPKKKAKDKEAKVESDKGSDVTPKSKSKKKEDAN